MTTQPTLTPSASATKWLGVHTTEKAASEEHFIDQRRMLGELAPRKLDSQSICASIAITPETRRWFG